eukprot:1786324-Rhodomonas_salina.1
MGSKRRKEVRGRDGEGMMGAQREEGREAMGCTWGEDKKGRDGVCTERGREGKEWGASRERRRGEGMGCVQGKDKKGRDGECALVEKACGQEGKGWGEHGEGRRGEEGWGKLWCAPRERKRGVGKGSVERRRKGRRMGRVLKEEETDIAKLFNYLT